VIILGIDPGTARCGYGLVEQQGAATRLLACGLIETPVGTPSPDRLTTIFKTITELIERFNPDAMAVEELFYGANVKTAMGVGQARGVIMLAAALKGLETAEYTPPQIKVAVTGYGRADKEQVRTMVKTHLNLRELKGHDDTSDAVAIALCHVFSCRLAGRIAGAEPRQRAVR
jgi:crossover junction endodeoxyribonuclease RuvC